MKYAFFDIKESWEKKLVLKKLPKTDVVFYKESISEVPEKELKKFDVISVFIYSKCPKEILMKMPKLKFIATRSTGFDHIDLAYCKSKKITVASVPFYGENTVAEFTFGLMINISRKVDQSIQRVRSGSFSFAGLRGFDLKGRTVGILGFGHIGQKFAKMCRGFDMNVIAYDPFADKLKDVADNLGVKMMPIDQMLKKSNIVSLHMPLLPQTKNIINKETLSLMKKDVILLNTSRGGLINTKDLLAALDSGKIGYVALDVLESENEFKDEKNFLERDVKDAQIMEDLLEDHELVKRHNVFVTPHNAFNTQDALERILNTTISNIVAFIEKKEIINEVKLK